ncbi:capsule biosynthesis protein [Clostridium sp. CS001]|uniref:capsule biosynthesis protein n=1 Tax=Clostridium sp. CS001 TaxID=2880648 RepID=UPI001CF4107D|nr:capsule biosynthesis protein [Clostridium sp. CS001]MCB2289047.1 capsule biosynthesis protein [Clostridium sp. CS001]
MIQTTDIMKDIEEQFKLFDVEIRAFYIWWVSKRKIFETIDSLRQKRAKCNESNVRSKIMRCFTTFKYIRSINLRRNKYKQLDILCLSDTASKRNNGFDYIFDYIGKYDTASYGILETLSGEIYSSKSYTENSYNLSNLSLMVLFYRRFYHMFLSRDEITYLKSIFDEVQFYILEKYEIDIPITKIVLENTSVLIKGHIYALNILRKVKPKVLYTQCFYSPTHIIFVYAAKMLNIKVVEFQHGLINEKHNGYIFHESIREKDPIPDYFCVFGTHFKNVILKINPKVNLNILEYGYPFLYEQLAENLKCIEEKEYEFIITTQGSAYAKHWCVFIRELLCLDLKCKILVKVHPNELMEYKDLYREVIGNPRVDFDAIGNIYTCLRKSKVHLSCFSTCHYEAIVCNIPTFVVKFPGWENVAELKEYFVCFINSAEELVESISANHRDISFNKFRKDYFNIDSYENIGEKLIRDIKEVNKFFLSK